MRSWRHRPWFLMSAARLLPQSWGIAGRPLRVLFCQMGLLKLLLPALGLIMGYTGDWTVSWHRRQQPFSGIWWRNWWLPSCVEYLKILLCGFSQQFVPLTRTLDYSTGAQQNFKDLWLGGPSNTVAVANGFGQAHPPTATLWSFPIYAKD